MEFLLSWVRDPKSNEPSSETWFSEYFGQLANNSTLMCKSLIIVFLSVVGLFTKAQLPIYFEHFYDRPIMPDIISSPYVINNSYYFLQYSSSVVVDSVSDLEFFKLDIDGETLLHKKYCYNWPNRGTLHGIVVNDPNEILYLGSGKATELINNVLEYRKFDFNGDTLFYKQIIDSAYHFSAASAFYMDDSLFLYNAGVMLDTLTLNPVKTYLLKMDVQGNIVYKKIIPGSERKSFSKYVCLNSGNCFYYGNYSLPNSSVNYGILIKVDPTGNVLWEQEFNENEYYGIGISRLSDGNMVLTGSQGNKAFLTKIDTAGIVIWDKRYDLAENEGESPYIARELINGNIVGVGISAQILTGSDNNGFIICVNSDGELKWKRDFGGPSVDYFVDFVEAPDKGYFITGSYNNETNQTSWVLKLDSMGCSFPGCVVGVDVGESKAVVADVWPNPFSNQLNIEWKGNESGTVTARNIIGEVVLEVESQTKQLNTESLPAGVYQIQIKQGNKLSNLKLIKQ